VYGALESQLGQGQGPALPLYSVSLSLTLVFYVLARLFHLLPRCMECRRGLAMRILSVRLSVKRVHCDKTEEKSVVIFIRCERSFSLVI